MARSNAPLPMKINPFVHKHLLVWKREALPVFSLRENVPTV